MLFMRLRKIGIYTLYFIFFNLIPVNTINSTNFTSFLSCNLLQKLYSSICLLIFFLSVQNNLVEII